LTFSTVSTNAAATLTAVTVTDYATVTMDSSDATITFSGALGGDQLTTVTLVGDNAISFGTISLANSAGDAITVNASAMTAGLTLDLNGAAGGVETVQGSTVADDIDATAVSSSGNNYVINTNAGNDTVTVSANAASTITLGDGNDTVEMDGGADVTINGGAGVDTMNVGNTVDLSSSTITLTSVEQIEFEEGANATDDATLASSFVDGLSIIFDDDDGATSTEVVVSMDETSVDLSGIGFSADFVDGTDFIRVDASSLGLATTIVGSSQGDFVDGSAAVDVINGGLGADTIDGNVGNDVITGGGGADTFVMSTGAGSDTITDWTTTTDKINVDDALDTGDVTLVGAALTAFDGTAAASDDEIINLASSAALTETDAAALFDADATDDADQVSIEDGEQVIFVVQDDDATSGTDYNAQVFLIDNTGDTITADLLGTFTTAGDSSAIVVGDFI